MDTYQSVAFTLLILPVLHAHNQIYDKPDGKQKKSWLTKNNYYIILLFSICHNTTLLYYSSDFEMIFKLTKILITSSSVWAKFTKWPFESRKLYRRI